MGNPATGRHLPATRRREARDSNAPIDLADALFTGTRQRVLAHLFGEPGRSFCMSKSARFVYALPEEIGAPGLPWLERLDGWHVAEGLLWGVLIIDLDVGRQGVAPFLTAADDRRRDDLGHAAVETPDHPMRPGCPGLDETMGDVGNIRVRRVYIMASIVLRLTQPFLRKALAWEPLQP